MDDTPALQNVCTKSGTELQNMCTELEHKLECTAEHVYRELQNMCTEFEHKLERTAEHVHIHQQTAPHPRHETRKLHG
jgi:hypothetical protein